MDDFFVSNFCISYFRALDINTLIGNVGGYIGLLIGVSISDLPLILHQVYLEIKHTCDFLKRLYQNNSI